MSDRPAEDEEREERLRAAREAWHAGDGMPQAESEVHPDGYSVGGNGMTPEFAALSWSELREIINERQPPETWR